MLKRFGGVFESLCIKSSCLDTFDLVALLTAIQLTGAKHGQWCRAVVRQVEIIIINYHDSNRIACKIPCHHSASVDSLSGFASSCWIGSLRKLDCPSNP